MNKEIKIYMDTCTMLQGEAVETVNVEMFETSTSLLNELVDLDGKVEMELIGQAEAKKAIRFIKEQVKALIENFNFNS